MSEELKNELYDKLLSEGCTAKEMTWKGWWCILRRNPCELKDCPMVDFAVDAIPIIKKY